MEKKEDCIFVGAYVPMTLEQAVRDYAKKNCECNFSMAIRILLKKGLTK